MQITITTTWIAACSNFAISLALLVVLISEQVHFFCDISHAFQRIGQRDFSLLYDLALSTKGDVALLFSNRLELYNAK
jgi:hypothetical protein